MDDLNKHKNEIAEAIKNDIFNGKLRPGEKIVEGRYAQKYNVSRTPIREAIRTLTSDFLLEHKKNSGAVVRVYGIAEINELYELRIALEKLKYQTVLEHLDDDGEQQLRNIYKQLSECNLDNKDDVIRTNKLFNQTVHSLLKTPIVKEWLDKIEDLFRYLRNIINYNVPQRWHDSVAEHMKLCQALIDHDADNLFKILVNHIKMSQKVYLEYSIDSVLSYK